MKLLEVCFESLLLVARYYFLLIQGVLFLFFRFSSFIVGLVTIVLFVQFGLKLFTEMF